MKTLIFWDSITEWNSDIEFGGWANRLRVFYLQNKKEKIVNLWIWWDEVEDILKRFDCMTKSYIEKYSKTPTFIFAIWINDSVTNIDNTKNNYTYEEFENNLKLLIEKARKYNPEKIVFVWLTNVDESLLNPFPWSSTWKCYKNERIKKFDKIIKEIALKNNFWYIPLFWLLENNEFIDWLHPNSIWHKKIFEKILDYLK